MQPVRVAAAVLVELQLHQRRLGADPEPRAPPRPRVGLLQVVDRAARSSSRTCSGSAARCTTPRGNVPRRARRCTRAARPGRRDSGRRPSARSRSRSSRSRSWTPLRARAISCGRPTRARPARRRSCGGAARSSTHSASAASVACRCGCLVERRAEVSRARPEALRRAPLSTDHGAGEGT